MERTMCDYSLESITSRPAVVGEKLVTTNFHSGTRGFRPADEPCGREMTAVCLLPGTELAFDAPVEVRTYVEWQAGMRHEYDGRTIPHKVARFAKIDADNHSRHHDGLEFPDHLGVRPVLLTVLAEGQTATVLQ